MSSCNVTKMAKKCILRNMASRTVLARLTAAVMALCFVCPIAESALDTEATAVASETPAMGDTNAELYRMMFEADMLTYEQYQYALEYGRLPGNGTLPDAAIPADKQETWNQLHSQGVISVEELVQMLGKGTISDLSPDELQAFEDLAPVYEPDRTKRVRYDIRKKHIIVDLIRLEHDQSQKEQGQREAGIDAAKRLGMPGGDGKSLENAAIIGCNPSGFPIYASSHNRESAEEIEADVIWGSYDYMDFYLSGDGVKLALRDIHLSATNHQEFSSQRVTQKVADSESEHATAVCGTICAEGVNTNAHGMAEDAQVDSYVRSKPMTFSSLLQSTPSVHIATHTYGQGTGWFKSGSTYVWYDWAPIVSSTNESGSFGRYEFEPKTLDSATYTAGYVLPVVSVGNDNDESYAGQWHYCSYYGGAYTNDYHSADGAADNGYDTLNPLACAKNALVVGATETGEHWPADYSSWGPTDDGRIKPDVTAPGGPVYSTSDSGTNQYTTLEGSSFSSAGAAGVVAMLQELHECAYGSEQPMLASTWRALLMHTADDGYTAGPDYRTGWGQINAYEAAKVITNNMSYASLPHIKELRLLDGETIEFDVVFPTGGWHQVSIGWTDPAGPSDSDDWTLDGTNAVLVNDLDLRVIGPSGTTNFPAILDPQSPTNYPTAGDDSHNNFEKIYSQIFAGTNRVSISHKGSLTSGMQDLSVIITDNTPQDAPEFRISDIGLVNSTGDVVRVQWPGVVGGRYNVLGSTNLLNSNGWTTVQQSLIANSTNLVWTNAVSESIEFYRLNRTR